MWFSTYTVLSKGLEDWVGHYPKVSSSKVRRDVENSKDKGEGGEGICGIAGGKRNPKVHYL